MTASARADEQQEPDPVVEPPAATPSPQPAPAAPAPPPPPPPAPAPHAADPRGAEGLRTDLERIVSSEEAGGWFLDGAHYDAMHPAVLQSTCRALPEARQLLFDRITAEAAVAGDPRTLFEASGRQKTSAVEQALHIQRMRTALDRAMKSECPFWVTPSLGYDGRQTDRNKFTLNGDIGTLLQLRFSNSRTTIGVGPSIRILAGYGFGRTSVLIGPEFAGGAMLRDEDNSKLVLNYFPALPIVVRIRDVNWIYSLETGLVSVFQGDNPRLSHGFRAGAGVGLMALRTRYFTPWAGIAAYYEHYFEGGGRPAAELLRGGFRVGIIYDP